MVGVVHPIGVQFDWKVSVKSVRMLHAFGLRTIAIGYRQYAQGNIIDSMYCKIHAVLGGHI